VSLYLANGSAGGAVGTLQSILMTHSLFASEFWYILILLATVVWTDALVISIVAAVNSRGLIVKSAALKVLAPAPAVAFEDTTPVNYFSSLNIGLGSSEPCLLLIQCILINLA